MRKIAHIINPVAVGQTSDLYIAQPITFESMHAAKRFAAETVQVEHYTAQYPEDHSIIPEAFMCTEDLDRSVLDFGTFRVQRKLPLIADILSRLYQASDAEFFVYTNVDIALIPNFYVSVNAIIDAGFDAFTINRRTLSAKYRSPHELPLMYADVGEPHPGYDCFVFKRSAVPEFVLNRVCVGAPRIGMVLVANMACTAKRFKEFSDDMHLTFHIGNDRTWTSPEFEGYAAHNAQETSRIGAVLASRYDGRELPVLNALQEELNRFFDQLRNLNKTGQGSKGSACKP